MTRIYETFFWWLALWMPNDSRFLWLLDDATHDEVIDEFWEAIAPRQRESRPWSWARKLAVLQKKYRPPTPMEAARRNMFAKSKLEIYLEGCSYGGTTF